MKVSVTEVGEVSEIVENLFVIGDDASVPKNIRFKIKCTAETLKSSNEKNRAVGLDKALQDLDEISENQNIPIYIRTQIWNVVTRLESLK